MFQWMKLRRSVLMAKSKTGSRLIKCLISVFLLSAIVVTGLLLPTTGFKPVAPAVPVMAESYELNSPGTTAGQLQTQYNFESIM
jgi:hypothetical protein